MFGWNKKVDKEKKELQDKLEYEKRRNDELLIKNRIQEEENKKILTILQNFIDSREKKDHKTWKAVEVKGKSFFFRPENLTYVGEIEESENNKTIEYCFEVIIDSKSKILKYDSLEECNQIRNLLLNIDEIPSEKEDEKKKKITRVFQKSLKKRVDEINSIDNQNNFQKKDIDLDSLEKEVKNKKQ